MTWGIVAHVLRDDTPRDILRDDAPLTRDNAPRGIVAQKELNIYLLKTRNARNL